MSLKYSNYFRENQETRYNKEDVDTEIAARQPGWIKMIDQDAQHRQGTKTIDFRAVFDVGGHGAHKVGLKKGGEDNPMPSLRNGYRSISGP